LIHSGTNQEQQQQQQQQDEEQQEQEQATSRSRDQWRDQAHREASRTTHLHNQLEQALSEGNALREQLMFVQASVDVGQQTVLRLEKARDVLSLRYAQSDTALREQAVRSLNAVLWTGVRDALGLGPSGAARKAFHQLAMWCVYVRANTDSVLAEASHYMQLFARAGIAWKSRAARVGFVELQLLQLSHRLPRPLLMPKTFVVGDSRTEALQLVSGLYRANAISLAQRDVLKEAMAVCAAPQLRVSPQATAPKTLEYASPPGRRVGKAGEKWLSPASVPRMTPLDSRSQTPIRAGRKHCADPPQISPPRQRRAPSAHRLTGEESSFTSKKAVSLS
jgi:hypothetical protein